MIFIPCLDNFAPLCSCVVVVRFLPCIVMGVGVCRPCGVGMRVTEAFHMVCV